MPNGTVSLIQRYFAAFDTGDIATMVSLVTDDVVHDVNQGERRHGRAAFQAFCTELSGYYQERLSDLVVMVNGDGSRAAAEFMIDGVYAASAPDLPPATGQRYRLPAGTFLEVRNGLISRVTTYYNLQDWLQQVTGE